jgi:Bardet-Biedl syndrome 5 protein
MSQEQETLLWRDSFLIPYSDLALRPGEVLIDRLEHVEDTKGNNGERGKLSVTNLRIMWESMQKTRVNLSVGYMQIHHLYIRRTNSKLAGQTEALYVLTKQASHQYEFIFTHLVPGSPRLFSTVQAVYRSYQTTKGYREIKVRAAILANKQLRLLPLEEVYDKIHGVFNVSNDQGSPGILMITNVRVVWYAEMNDYHNVSIPYLQMKSIGLRESKFGKALVLETHKEAGGYALGFTVEPKEKLKDASKQIVSLHRVFKASPIFGIEYSFEEIPEQGESRSGPQVAEEEDEVVDSGHKSDVFALYCVGNSTEKVKEPVYNEELGLAVEKLPEGMTIQELWSVT